MATITMPERFKFVDATAGPVTTNGAVTGQYISAKTANRITLSLQFTQAVGHATAITLKEATAVAGTGVQTVANTMEVWSNLATATDDTLVKRADATGYTLGSGIAKMMVVFDIDPARLSDGFDCVGFSIADSSQATNFVSGQWIIETKYAQATPPSAVVN